jgi:hypothetical protein
MKPPKAEEFLLRSLFVRGAQPAANWVSLGAGLGVMMKRKFCSCFKSDPVIYLAVTLRAFI